MKAWILKRASLTAISLCLVGTMWLSSNTTAEASARFYGFRHRPHFGHFLGHRHFGYRHFGYRYAGYGYRAYRPWGYGYAGYRNYYPRYAYFPRHAFRVARRAYYPRYAYYPSYNYGYAPAVYAAPVSYAAPVCAYSSPDYSSYRVDENYVSSEDYGEPSYSYELPEEINGSAEAQAPVDELPGDQMLISLPLMNPAEEAVDNLIQPLTDTPGWSQLAAGDDITARRMFVRQSQQDPRKGTPRVGFALAAACEGDFSAGSGAMHGACGADPRSLSDIQVDAKLRPRLLRLASRYVDQLQKSSDKQKTSFMLASLNYLLGNTSAARGALNQAAAFGDNSQSVRQLARLIEERASQQRTASQAPAPAPEKPSSPARTKGTLEI